MHSCKGKATEYQAKRNSCLRRETLSLTGERKCLKAVESLERICRIITVLERNQKYTGLRGLVVNKDMGL